MWEINIVNKHYDKNNGTLVGFTVRVDNGDTQYMSIGDYDKFLKNREKNGIKRKNKD